MGIRRTTSLRFRRLLLSLTQFLLSLLSRTGTTPSHSREFPNFSPSMDPSSLRIRTVLRLYSATSVLPLSISETLPVRGGGTYMTLWKSWQQESRFQMILALHRLYLGGEDRTHILSH